MSPKNSQFRAIRYPIKWNETKLNQEIGLDYTLNISLEVIDEICWWNPSWKILRFAPLAPLRLATDRMSLYDDRTEWALLMNPKDVYREIYLCKNESKDTEIYLW